MVRTENSETQCGLRALTMIEYGRKDRKFGHVQATVEPSQIINQGRTGIYMLVNDHYQLERPDQATDAREIITVLSERFDESVRNSERIIDQVMALKQ